MTLYATKRAPDLASPELAGFLTDRILDGFGAMSCADVTGDACRDYAARRMAGKIGRTVTAQTAKRELQHLSAALRFAWREGLLSEIVPVTYPITPGKRRERWLTRSEAARLLAGALGWYAVASDIRTREVIAWARNPDWINRHLARFIAIGLYTGTRHDAINRLRWHISSDGGWIDLDRAVIYRRGDGERETAKRRPPVPMTDQLVGHMRRARGVTLAGPVEHDGETLAKVRRAWKRARLNAGLGAEVTPHVLRHTCATWMLLRGVSTRDVADWLGTTERVITATYGHHSPHHLAQAKASFRRINAASSRGGT